MANMYGSTTGLMIIFAFAFIPLVIAEVARNKFRYTLEDFFIQSRGMNAVMSYFTIAATWISSYSLLGATRSYSLHGPLYLTSFAWTVLFGLIIYVVGRRVWLLGKNHGYITAADFFDDIYRYRPLSITVTAVIAVFTIPYLILQIQGGAFLIRTATDGGIPYAIGGLIFYLVVIIFLWAGGLRAIAMTDIFYFLMIALAMGLVLVFFIGRAGSAEACFTAVENAVGEDFFRLAEAGGEKTVIKWLALFLIIPIGAFMGPPMWLRMYSIGKASTFRFLPLVLAVVPIIYIGTVFAGIEGAAEDADALGKDMLLVSLVQQHMKPLPAIVVFCGIAAAAISTANAQIHSLSSVITIDIYKKHINRQATDRELVKTGKWAVFAISTGAYILMLCIDTGIINMGLLSLSGTMQVFTAVLGALFWRKSNPKAAMAGIWVGVATVFIFGIAGINLAVAGVTGFLLNVGIFLLGSIRLSEDRLAYERISSAMEEFRGEWNLKKLR